MDLHDQNFGIEIEMTGITREQAAKITAAYFGTCSAYEGTYYGVYTAKDPQGRKWKFMSDGSLTLERIEGERISRTSDKNYSVEMVSPICQYRDIETIQEIVRRLRAAGAISNDSCGIHIHVDASPFDAKALRNIVNIIASKEDLLYKALQVEVHREYYCKKTNREFLQTLNRRHPKTVEGIGNVWYDENYDYDHAPSEHYHSSRYHCLNLHSVFTKGTVEFRLFNSEIQHAGKIKAYIQLCLAISAQALNQKSASYAKTQTTNEKYTFRTWLLRLGLIGDEFKTARMHLLEHLDGCIAWKDPAQAERQKERLRQKREKELAERQMREGTPDPAQDSRQAQPGPQEPSAQDAEQSFRPEQPEVEEAQDSSAFTMSITM